MNSILFGNGLNRLSQINQSWEELLNDIKGSQQFINEELPNTMIYERILFERPLRIENNILDEEFSVKERIAEAYKKVVIHPIYKDLYSLNAHNYLSTNYDYAFRDSISKAFSYKYFNKSTEDIYSIRRKIEIVENGGPSTNIWHIHGEVKYPKTIMLGLDHYCGEIGKIDNLIKGKYEYVVRGKNIKLKSIKEKLVLNEPDGVSWVELFFTSNLYILGFSFDYSEIDLWWVLTKRARLIRESEVGNKIKNKIYFYCSSIEESKKGLLKSLGVEVVEIVRKGNYESNYRDMIDDIRMKIERAEQ